MLKEELLNQYKYKFELHAHSKPVSKCSEIPTETLVQYFIEDGFHGFALTNHFMKDYFPYGDAKKDIEYYLADYYKIKSLAKDRLSVCLGMEIRFTENENDYLVYGIDENDFEKAYHCFHMGIAAFYKEFKNDKNVIIQAHPFRDGMVLAEADCIDGIELVNFHPNHTSKNPFAAKFLKEHQEKVFTGGIDFHHVHQRNLTAARFKELPKNSYELAQIIQSKDMIFTMGDSIILP